ncbi:MAG: dienelactone hydrolase family protein [Deltaproteobacteria bacterium]|nr:dienelactone hydrolase family protein [Deltaproteobacteria bacterium]
MAHHGLSKFSLFSILSLLLFLGACGSSNGGDSYTEKMAKEHEGDTPVASPAATGEAKGEVEESAVTYAEIEGKAVRGFLARPSGGANLPGIVVIQEWWGLNDNIRSMARQLAGEGYTALAVDLYGGEVGTTRDEARSLMSAAMGNPAAAQDNLRQAISFLRDQQGASKVGSIGWCFGGYWSLQTALLGQEDVQASVIYYGRPEDDTEKLAQLESPVLGHYGSLDQGIPLASIEQLEKNLESLGKEAELHVYENADHAFANPSGTRYNEEAADQAWERTLAFFSSHLGGR